MTYSYFPGCTLKTRAKDLDHWGRESMKALGIELAELPEWQGCGAVYPIARDEIALRLSSVRALAAARDLNQPLVTLCSACHHVIKRVNGDMRSIHLTSDPIIPEICEKAQLSLDFFDNLSCGSGVPQLFYALRWGRAVFPGLWFCRTPGRARWPQSSRWARRTKFPWRPAP